MPGSERTIATRARTAHESEKEQAILKAALELFSEVGFDATPVPRIAEKAGVGAGTIYRYFESKELLLNALYRQWKETLLVYLQHEFPLQGSVEDRFRHFFRALVAFEADHPRAFMFLEFHHHAPNLDQVSQALERDIIAFVHGFLEQATTTGAVRPLPPDAIIALVQGSFVGLVKARNTDLLTFTPALLREVEDCCWEAIRSRN